jgi:hypothetical protein
LDAPTRYQLSRIQLPDFKETCHYTDVSKQALQYSHGSLACSIYPMQAGPRPRRAQRRQY